jgi:hypothetical protein
MRNGEELVRKLQFLISRHYYVTGLKGLGTTKKKLKIANYLVEIHIEYFPKSSQSRYFSVYMIFFWENWHTKFSLP